MKFKEYFKENTNEVIYRALPFSADDIFRVGDYVTKSEKFAREHGETSAIYNGEDYKVIRALVPSSAIKPASNPGEFLMVSEVQGKGIWKLSIDDATQMVTKERIRNLEEAPMFHGSNVKFDKPKEGMIHWVTPSKELAQEYASGAVVHRKGGEPIVYEHDIDVKHPAIVNDEYSPIMRLLSKWYEARPNKESSKEAVVAAMNAIREKWHEIGLDNSDTSVFNHWNMTGVDGNHLLINFLELLGYDSIYFKEFGHDTYGVWKL